MIALFYIILFKKLKTKENAHLFFEESSDIRLAIAQSLEKCYCQTSANSKISEILLRPDSTGLTMALVSYNCYRKLLTFYVCMQILP